MIIKNKRIPGTLTLLVLTFSLLVSQDVQESMPEVYSLHHQLLVAVDSLQKELTYYREREIKFLGRISHQEYTAVAYLPVDSLEGRHSGLTATGALAKPYVTVAVDPKVVPINSWIWIDGLGWRRAEDTGIKIKGKKIDLCVSSREEAMEFGVRKMRIKILK